MLSKSLIQFSVDAQGCVPSLLFGWGQTMVVLMTSFKRTCAHPVVFSVPDPAAGHCRLRPPLETSWTFTGTSGSVSSDTDSPGSWCTQGFICTLQESVSPVLWMFCNQIPLASRVKFPGGSQSLCRVPGKSVVGPRAFLTVQEFLSYNCLPGSSMVGLMVTSSKRAYATHCMTKVCCSQIPCPWSRPLLTCASAVVTQTLKVRSGSVSVEYLGPGAHKLLFEPPEHLWRVVLGPLLCPWMWVFFVFFGGIQHFPVNGSAAGCSFGVLSGEDECTSFYSAILCVSCKCVVNTILNWKKRKSRLKY